MPPFRELYFARELLSKRDLAVRFATDTAVPLHAILDLRQGLVDARRLLSQVDTDPGALFQVDARILQADNLHRALASDGLAFLGMRTKKQPGYSVKTIVTAVQSCTLLRDSGDLQRQLRHAVQFLMPEQSEEVLQAIDAGMLHVPSASCVSRSRLAVDVGFMLFMRKLNSEASDQAVRCLLTDSSPQRGFDWLLTETHTLGPADFEVWTRVTWEFARTRRQAEQVVKALESVSPGHDVEQLQSDLADLKQKRVTLQKMLDTCQPAVTRSSQSHPVVDVHIHPPSALGSQRASLVHKIHALLHVLQLDIGAWPAVSQYLASIRGVCTDFGVEAGLAEVRDVDVTEMFPWSAEAFHFEVPQDEPAQGFEHAGDQQPAGQVVQDEFLEIRRNADGSEQILLPRLFPLAMQIPGALHVLHHAVEELTDSFEQYKEWFLPRLKAVTNVLGKKFNRERFVTETLRESPASAFETSVLNLELNLHEARWGTLISTCKSLLAIRLVFLYWNEAIFGAAPAPNNADASAEELRSVHQDLPLMTEAVRDPFWWQYLAMLLRVARVIDHLEHWMEACPCHFKHPDPSDPLHGNKAFRTRYSCHMAGRRAPELASGALHDLVKKTFQSQHTQILADCAVLSVEQGNKILQDFAAGQARLEQFFTLKFSFWKTLPHKLCVLGHFMEDIARAGLQEAADMFREHQDSGSHHPLTLRFFQGCLREDVTAFLEGRIRRSESSLLLKEAAAVGFLSCVERSIEARHALLKAKTTVMKRISPATFSLAIRAHELYRRCFHDRTLLREWEAQVARAKKCGRKGLPQVLPQLGFTNHPEVLRIWALGADKVRIREAANIVYHTDLGTQYHKRASAAKTMQQPKNRDNPDDAKKVRQHIASQASNSDKHAALLRILMLEDFRSRCKEGRMYSVQGALPPMRLLRDALVPSAALPQPALPAAPALRFASPDPVPEDMPLQSVPSAPQQIVEHVPDQTSVFLQAGDELTVFEGLSQSNVLDRCVVVGHAVHSTCLLCICLYFQ